MEQEDSLPSHFGKSNKVKLNQPVINSAANRLIGEVVQLRRRPLLGPSPG